MTRAWRRSRSSYTINANLILLQDICLSAKVSPPYPGIAPSVNTTLQRYSILDLILSAKYHNNFRFIDMSLFAQSTQEELVETIIGCLELLDPSDQAVDPLLGYLYQPHSALGDLLEKLKAYSEIEHPSKTERLKAGRLMEQIAGVVFSQIKGASSIESYQSAAAQYDLLVSGDGLGWSALTKALYMKTERRGILVEAKARSKKLTDKEFSRLIAILESHLTTVGLGVFLTIHGASGFPKPGAAQRALKDCQIRQALYFAKTEKAIIVFDLQDLASLNAAGALPRLIARKIRALSALCTHPIDPVPAPKEVTLPLHISSVLKNS